jgi:hypothetical protein
LQKHFNISWFPISIWHFEKNFIVISKLHFITIVISFIFVDKWIVRYSLTFEFIVVIPMVRSHIMVNCLNSKQFCICGTGKVM